MLEKEDGGDNYSFSNSPKKEHEKLPGRKESDFSYGQGRKNSFLSNFGGHGQFNYNNYNYSPFNGPMAKDSVDFGYHHSNYFGDTLD